MKGFKQFTNYLIEILSIWKEGYDWFLIILFFIPIVYSPISLYLNIFNSSILLVFSLLFFIYSSFKVYIKRKEFEPTVSFDDFKIYRQSLNNNRIVDKDIEINFKINNPTSEDIFLEEIIPSSSDISWYGSIQGSSHNTNNFYPFQIKAGRKEHIKRYLSIRCKLDLSNSEMQKLYDANSINTKDIILKLRVKVNIKDKIQYFEFEKALSNYFNL